MTTTSSNDPDALRREIEETRANLSQNVNALGEAVQPSNIAKRQVSKAKGAATGVKDKIMGTAEDKDQADQARENVSGSRENVAGY